MGEGSVAITKVMCLKSSMNTSVTRAQGARKRMVESEISESILLPSGGKYEYVYLLSKSVSG